jgi:hypothetical protein
MAPSQTPTIHPPYIGRTPLQEPKITHLALYARPAQAAASFLQQSALHATDSAALARQSCHLLKHATAQVIFQGTRLPSPESGNGVTPPFMYRSAVSITDLSLLPLLSAAADHR